MHIVETFLSASARIVTVFRAISAQSYQKSLFGLNNHGDIRIVFYLLYHFMYNI